MDWKGDGASNSLNGIGISFGLDWGAGTYINHLELGGRGAGTTEDDLSSPKYFDHLCVKGGGAARVAQLADG